MQKKRIGELIKKIRVQQGVTQKQLCDGLCSIQTLSNIESAERMPDVFLVEYLLQRLGVSPDDLEIVLFDNEYCEIELRDSIEEKIEQGRVEEAEALLEENLKSDRGISGQYYYQIKAVFASIQMDYEKSLKCIEKALACTHFDFSKQGKSGKLLSTREIELLCMMVEEYLFIEDKAKAKEIVDFLAMYLETHAIQDMELVKTYPKMAYLSAYFANSNKEKVESTSRCEKAFQLLTSRASTVFLAEIMKLLIEQYRELNLVNKAIRLEKQLDSLETLYQEYGGCADATQNHMKWFKESCRKEYLLCEELIRGERLARGLKRSELIEGIYEDPETLMRIENGSQSPSYKKYELLMRRLNMSIEKYSGSPISDEDVVFQSKNKIGQHLIKHDYEEAREELEKLKLLIEDEDYISKQYIAKEEIYLEYKINQMDAETFRKRTQQVLALTYAGELDGLSRIPTLEEAYIFNYLSLSYRKCNMQEESLKLYQKLLECYRKSKVRETYHYRILTILHRNYLALLEEMERKEDALKVAEAAMKFELSASRGKGLDYICTEIMCVYEKLEINDSEKKKAIEKYL
ncbi:MAG: helix-turn-helix transcriptional regulator [Agathobacter sp.]|nr:helix-turn-helix transcriptional regulator [Agathobacter sp.]